MTRRLAKLFTAKQEEVFDYYLHHKFRTMVLVGAVRAGKTYIDNFIFACELKRVAKQAKLDGDTHPQFILAGATAGSIYNNVISEMERQFGQEFKADKHGHYHIFGIDIVTVYTGKKNGVQRARGFTAWGAYINEASLCVREMYDEIQNRCSKPDSHVIMDTNPDVPTHWLKKDVIDNSNKDSGIKTFTFTIDDNTTLDPGYVKALKASKPAGVFYDRDILGRWATGAGIVYSDFDEKTMVIDDDKVPDGLDYYIGVDWGFAKGHECVLELWGDDDDGTSYLIKCYSYTGKYIDYWINTAHNVIKEYGYGIPAYCDSARPDYVQQFHSAGINSINANKRVMDGIEYCSEQIKKGKVKIARSASAPFLQDIFQYQWDEKTGVPVKANDNTMDAMRYALFTHHNQTFSTATRQFIY